MTEASMREAATRALAQMEGTAQAGPVGSVVRMAVDVACGDTQEIVSFQVRRGELVWSCTCMQPVCEHARTALGLLAQPPEHQHADDSQRDDASGTAVSDGPGASLPWLPGQEASGPPVALRAADLSALSESLEDVVTAVVRTGLTHGEAASVSESLERLVRAAPQPLPLGVSRWIGRLRWELNQQDPQGVARVLDGASRLVIDLQRATGDGPSRTRFISWLGAKAGEDGVRLLSDRTFVELGRELVDGAERVSIERRHLMDLDSGELFREEQMKGRKGISLGTCPRLINVGLAEVERGAEPSRIRLLQYASSPHLSAQHWEAVGGWATRNYADLVDRYLAALAQFPGLSEPSACVWVERMKTDGGVHLVDGRGARLPLAGGARLGTLALFKQRLSEIRLAFVLGRLEDQQGLLTLRPIAAAIARDGRFEHVRI